MDSFFDEHGRDRIIHDWIKRNKPDFLPVYEGTLARIDRYRNFNIIFLMAFEAGYEFAKASKREDREAKVDYKYQEMYS